MKNLKHLITLALPLVAMSLTSCYGTEYLTYEQMRNFASRNYDQNALDTVPATFTANLNTMRTNINVSYVTPAGVSESFDINFGISDTHVVIKNQYAYCLSSTVVDSVEKYYSDFVGIALTLKEEPPVEMTYQLHNGNRTKIDMTTSQKIVGDFMVKLLQLGVGTLDMISTTAGYLPIIGEGEDAEEVFDKITNPITKLIAELIYSFGKKSKNIDPAPVYPDYPVKSFSAGASNGARDETYNLIASLSNYLTFTVSNSSKSYGDVFDSYITTDRYGFINVMDFNFKSNFEITGLAAFKKYEHSNPTPGEQPVATDAPYSYVIKGSVDYDFDITCNIVG